MDTQKQFAINFMEKLDIYKPYINGFKKQDDVCFFEGFGGFWVHQEPEIEAKMKELEQRYEIKVYAITHEITDFGELYDFLYIPKNLSECCIEKVNNTFYVDAYVWNKTDDNLSEFGAISIQSFGGGIRRIG